MASTVITPSHRWDTLHDNLENNPEFTPVELLTSSLESKALLPDPYARYVDMSDEIRRLLDESLAQGKGFRAFGSRWSLSYIAYHKDRMHNNTRMNISLPLSGADFCSDTEYATENIFFFECGNIIAEVSEHAHDYGKSLKTSGASNGQTLAGAISTGVHGSAFDVGAIHDSVVGLNLILGPLPEDVVYLERSSKPVLNEGFAEKIQARIIRDDALFYSALVGLGSFGFIHGVAIELEDLFLLQRYTKKIPKGLAMELAESLDFEHTEFGFPEEVSADGKKLRPYHYKLFVNPYNNEQDYVVEVMYKKPYFEPYPNPLPEIRTSIYRDLIILLKHIAEKFPRKIPKLIEFLKDEVLPEPDESTLGTLREIFWSPSQQGRAFACSFGVDHSQSARVLEILIRVANEAGPVPGLYGLRFVKASAATLAFTRFPVTCVLEMDGVLWDENKDKIISLEAFSRAIIEALQAEEIPFTMHWGKNADWTYPGLVTYMYGEEKVADWKMQRSKLLRPEMAALFSNTFLQDVGLHDPGFIA